MGDIVERLRKTTEEMASNASVPMWLWQRHSTACLDAADTISALTKRVEELEGAVSKIAVKAAGGICQFHDAGKHAFLRDISFLCEASGFDVLGDKHPTPPQGDDPKEALTAYGQGDKP